jgi:hypothetical protein
MDFSGHVDIKSLLRYRHPKVDQTVARLRALEQGRASGLTTATDALKSIVQSRSDSAKVES